MKLTRVFALAISAMFLLTGCGKDLTESTAPIISQQDSTAAETESPKEDIVIKMAIHTSINQEVSIAVRAFNEADNGYKIEYVDYDEYDDASSYDEGGGLLPGGFAKADFELQMDILKGDTVHIVPDVAFGDEGKFDILTEKGAFIDLYPFLDGDAEINRDTLDTHILELSETDGKLCCLPTFYRIEGMIGKTEYVGKKEGWTFAELKERWEAMPDNATFNYQTTKYGVYWEILRDNLGAFLDYENGTCSFDSPEFVEMLEFCNSFDVIYDKSQPDGRNPNFVTSMMVDCFNSFHWDVSHDSGEYTLVGYPTNEGNGAFLNTTYSRYAICVDTPPEVQEGAWEFLRMLMDEDFCCDMSNAYNNLVGFPVNRAAFERLAQEELNRPEEEQYSHGNMTQEEYERLCAYIQSIDKINDNIDDDLETIVNEEIDLLFNGEYTAQQCADMIQSRASLYISERS